MAEKQKQWRRSIAVRLTEEELIRIRELALALRSSSVEVATEALRMVIHHPEAIEKLKAKINLHQSTQQT